MRGVDAGGRLGGTKRLHRKNLVHIGRSLT